MASFEEQQAVLRSQAGPCGDSAQVLTLGIDSMPMESKDGIHWVPAVPLPDSRQIRVEKWFARHGMRPIARLLGWWDELWLG